MLTADRFLSPVRRLDQDDRSRELLNPHGLVILRREPLRRRPTSHVITEYALYHSEGLQSTSESDKGMNLGHFCIPALQILRSRFRMP